MNALTGFGFEFLLMANQKSQTSFFGTQNQTSNMLLALFCSLVRVHWAFWFSLLWSEPARKLKAYRNPTTRPLRPTLQTKVFALWMCACSRVFVKARMYACVCVCVRLRVCGCVYARGHKTEISCNWSLRFAFAFWFCCGWIGLTVVM